MTLALAALNKDDVWRCLAQRFRGPPDREALLRALVAEHIRALVFASAVREAEVGVVQRTHTTRLTASVRRNISSLTSDALSPPDGEDVVLLTLAAMDELGDVVNTGGGFWLAAPLRFISCPGTDDLLAIGGIPRETVEHDTSSLINLAAASRIILSFDARNRAYIARSLQPFDTWLGTMEPIGTWTEVVLDTHRQRFSPPEEVPNRPATNRRAVRLNRLLNYLVGGCKQRLWNGETKRPCGLEIDDHRQPNLRLHRKVGRLLAAKDAVEVRRRTTELIGDVNAIRYEAAARREETESIDGWQAILIGEFDDLFGMNRRENLRHDDEAAIRFACECFDPIDHLALVVNWDRAHLKSIRSGGGVG
jgi:hypothetical protein